MISGVLGPPESKDFEDSISIFSTRLEEKKNSVKQGYAIHDAKRQYDDPKSVAFRPPRFKRKDS